MNQVIHWHMILSVTIIFKHYFIYISISFSFSLLFVVVQANKMLKPEKWQTTFDSEGKVLGFQKALKLIILGVSCFNSFLLFLSSEICTCFTYLCNCAFLMTSLKFLI